MTAWWETLDNTLRILYCIALPATLLLLLQTVLSVAGGLADGGAAVNPSDTSGLDLDGGEGGLADVDLDDLVQSSGDGSGPHDGSVLRLLTLQGIVAFLTVFSWSSIVAIQTGAPQGISLLLGLALGLLAMVLIAKMVQAARRLAENGTLNVKNAIGETGEVYLTVPPAGQGAGKVMVRVQGQLGEFSAITPEQESLKTGEVVRVTDLRGEMLVVERE